MQIVNPGQIQAHDCFVGSLSSADPSSGAELLNLQPFLEAEPSFSLADFYPQFLDAFLFQSDLCGVPTQAQVRVVFYNRDLFDAAGVPYPEPDRALDDFLAYAVVLTRGDGNEKQYGFLPLNGDTSDLQVFLALHGESLWDEKGRPRFDTPGVVAAVQWYADLVLKYGVTPAFPNDLPDRSAEAQDMRNALVRTGQVAMWTDFIGIDRGDVWPVDTHVGMVPLPTGAERVTEFLYEGLFIAADTPNSQACWEWLKFLSAQTETVRGLPARRSSFESEGFAEQMGQDAVETYRASLGYADLHRPATSEASAQIYWVFQALGDILVGEQAGAALAEAQRQAEE